VRLAITAITVIAVLFTATCGGHVRDGAQVSALTPADTSSIKTTSAIPASERLVVLDAGIALSAGGYTLSWKYANPGDYGQDGKASVEDVTPIAQHFGEAVSPDNEWIKVNGTGVIGVSEITPIAMNWASEVTGYRIDGAPSANGPWNEVASLTLDNGDDTNGRLAFSDEIAVGYTYYRIATLTPDGDAAYSDILIAPSDEPAIYSVTPTSGYQHEECTFTVTSSGQEPLTYAWDFGGGTTPNTSSDISPTVTFSDAGEYSASLTISNSYGPTTFPFTITISARDMWVHTWGGSSHEQAIDVCTDDDGNIYVLGKTRSFGAGEQDSLVLKYAADGSLLWARTWGGSSLEYPCRIFVQSDGMVITGGYTKSFGVDMDDVYILKYDSSGILLLQKTWGTTGYERTGDMAVDDTGNMYFVGSYFPTGGVPDMMALKLTADGTAQWAKAWGGGGLDDALCVSVDAESNVYVAGSPDCDSPNYNVVLHKFDENGQLLWAKSWGGAGIDSPSRILPGKSGDVVVTGSTNSFGAGNFDVFLLKWDQAGGILNAMTWGTSAADTATGLFINESGNFSITSQTKGLSSSWQGVLINVSDDLELTTSRCLDSESTIAGICGNEFGDVLLVGYAFSGDWAWGVAPGTTNYINVETVDYLVTPIDIDGIAQEVEGTSDSPMGTQDIGGGGTDALVIKNYPR
jgi:PKD repeat protein